MRLTLFFLTLCLPFSLYANQCPSVADLQHHHLSQHWQFLDSEDGKPLSQARKLRYIKTVNQFALAEWENKPGKTNAIHCYYRDKSGSALDAFIASANLKPKPSNYWYQVSGYQNCAAGVKECQFSTPAKILASSDAKHHLS